MKENCHSTVRFANFQFNTANSLGKGATGEVYRGYRLTDGASFAIKVVNMNKVNNEVLYYLHQSQKKAMSVLKHHNIIKTQQIFQQKDWCYFVMEECRGGTLKDYIEQRGKLDCETAIQFFKQIVNGYIDVIDAHIIHRDIKPANIMLRNQKEPVIIDFGYCELMMSKRPMASYNVGSPSYMSPQAFLKSRYSEKSDVWGLGATLYEMVTGKTLDNGMQSKQFFDEMIKRNSVLYDTLGLSGVVKNLLEAALKISPEQRATAHRLKYIIDKSMISKIVPVRCVENDYNTPFSAGHKSSYYLPMKNKHYEENDYNAIRSKPLLTQMPQNAMRRKISISIHEPQDRQQFFRQRQNGDYILERMDDVQSRKQAKISLNDVCSFQSKKRHFQHHEQKEEQRVFRTTYKINEQKHFNENLTHKQIKRRQCNQTPFYHHNNTNCYQNAGNNRIEENYKENHKPILKRFVTETRFHGHQPVQNLIVKNVRIL